MSNAVIGNLRVDLGLNTAQFEAGAKRAESTLAGLSGSMKTFGAGIVGALSLGALASAVDSVIRKVAEIGDVAESIGVTAEQLQVFNRMALASGASTDVMARGLQSIAEQSAEANSALSRLFAANGLAVQGREINEVVRDFMTLLQNAKSPADQLAIATSVLGTRVGRNLVEAFRAGAAGVDEATKSMVESGNYFSNAEIARVQEIETQYNQVMANIATGWQRMIVGIVDGISSISIGAANAPEDMEFLPGGGGRSGGIRNPNYKKPTGLTPFPVVAGGKVDLPALKPTILPSTPQQTARPSITKPSRQVLPITVEDIRGPALELSNLNEQLEISNTLVADLTSGFANQLSYSLVDIASNAKSAGDAFDMMKSTALSALQGITQQLLNSGLNMLLGGMGVAPSQAGAGLLGALFGGFRANGGRVNPGMGYIVGERGPEWFQPDTAGRVHSNNRSGGIVVKNNVINNSGAQVQTRATQNNDGSIDIDTFVEDKVIDALGGGRAARVMGGRYGARIMPRRT